MKMYMRRLFVFGGLCVLTASCGGDATSSGDAALQGKQSASHPNVHCEDTNDTQLCAIRGVITQDLHLAFDDHVTWLLSGPVFVGNDTDETILAIDAGVTVFADAASSETTFLTVRRGSKILAEGTADAPIVFTPTTPEGQRQRGLWGGLILNGRAPLNSGSEAEGEGNTGKYGGNDANDSSGVLKYVRVEFAGDLITSEDELNGIAFQGVGRGTIVDFVQVHMSSDDGVEFFGGTVEVKHLVLTGIGDDSLDWTDGWQGKAQFVVAQQFNDKGDRGIEADNNGANHSAEPRSQPVLSNLTLIGGAGGDTGMVLRRGTGAAIYNAIVVGFANACLDIDDAATYQQGWDATAGMLNGSLLLRNSLIYGCGKTFAADADDGGTAGLPFSLADWFAQEANNQQADPMLISTDDVNPDYRPRVGSPALVASEQPEGDAFFSDVSFIGAVGRDDDWTAGWTIHARN